MLDDYMRKMSVPGITYSAGEVFIEHDSVPLLFSFKGLWNGRGKTNEAMQYLAISCEGLEIDYHGYGSMKGFDPIYYVVSTDTDVIEGLKADEIAIRDAFLNTEAKWYIVTNANNDVRLSGWSYFRHTKIRQDILPDPHIYLVKEEFRGGTLSQLKDKVRSAIDRFPGGLIGDIPGEAIEHFYNSAVENVSLDRHEVYQSFSTGVDELDEYPAHIELGYSEFDQQFGVYVQIDINDAIQIIGSYEGDEWELDLNVTR